MPTLMEQAKALRAQIDADTAEAKTKWSEFDGMRKSAISEGVDFTKNTDAFTKLDEAGKAYDGLRDVISAKTAQWQRLMQLAHEDAGTDFGSGVKGAESARETAIRSLGAKFVNSAEYKAAQARLGSHADMPFGSSGAMKLVERGEMKTLFTSTSGGPLFQNDVRNLIVPIPTVALSLLDVIPSGTTDSDTIEFQEETTWTNAAAGTAEGDASPESALAYTTRTRTVEDITHHLPATKRSLADAGQAESLINARLVNGVRVKLQDQIVNGDGTSPNLRGMLNVASILTQALSTDSRSDAVHKAITKIRVAGEGNYTPRYFGIHPSDWEDLALEKDVNGRYYFGGPAGTGSNTVWGLVPIITTVFAAGTPAVFDEQQMMIWYRTGLEVAMSDSHSDFFTKKKVAVMASLRAAFGVFTPNGLCSITGF